MCSKESHNPGPAVRRRMERLSRASSDVNVDDPSIEELTGRLEALDVPPIVNVLRLPLDPIRHANVSAFGAHGGLVPGP